MADSDRDIVRVKICGITRVEDALRAIACGADALGFVFHPESPRYLQIEQARDIIAELPPFVTTVGLFVNAAPETVRQTVAACRIDAVQYHGDESPAECALAPVRAIKALRVRDAGSLSGHHAYTTGALLLDAWSPAAYGGTGETFEWSLAETVARDRTVILAGGLTAENVAEAISVVRPFAVDVSSGVESKPGVKDLAKMTDFIAAVKGST